MFCPYCGAEARDGICFCESCGTKLPVNAASTAATAQPEAQPSGQAGQDFFYQPSSFDTQPPVRPASQPINPAAQTAAQAANPVIQMVRQSFLSPWALVAVIGFSAMVLLQLIQSFMGYNSVLYEVISGLSDLGVSRSDLMKVFGSFFTFYRVWAVILTIPSLLLAAGMWLTYAAARNRQSLGMRTTGLTVSKAALIVQLVLASLASLAILVLMVIAIVTIGSLASSFGGYYSNDYYGHRSSAGIGVPLMILILVLVLAAIALVVMVYVKGIQTTNALRDGARTGAPKQVSAFLGVMAFIMGGIYAIYVIASLTNYSSALAIFSNLATAVADIGFGVYLFSYRGKLKALFPRVTVSNAGQ